MHAASNSSSVRISNRKSNSRLQKRRVAAFRRCTTEVLEARRMLFGGTDVLVNNNGGAGTTSTFTQSETTVISFGSNIVIGFNDSGSNSGGGAHFTGWATSTNGGTSFTDGGVLPTHDAGDPILARNDVTGRIYFATLGFSTSLIQIFRSDTNGASWQAATVGTPGGSSEDKEFLTVDNAAGAGQGNVYLTSRRFAGATGMYFHRSLDHGATFSTGLQLWAAGAGVQGGNVVVGTDHAIYAFALVGNTTYQMRKSTDQGVTFSAAVTIATGQGGGTNGDLALTGMRNGTATFNSFRSNGFSQCIVNPVSGDLYMAYANNPAGADKADIQLIMSSNGGATWSLPTRVNDDATTLDQFQPALAVTPNGQNLGIFYYSREADATNNQFRYRGRIATISGATLNFGASEDISDVASLPEFGRDSVVNTVYMGDYDMAAADNSFFYAVWADNRSALPGGGVRMDPNVYFDKIPIPVNPNGIWDGGGDGVNWTDPVNWSNNVLPTAADDAIINIAGVQNVVLSSGAQVVKSLTSAENLTISGGSLQVDNPSSMTGNFTLSGGTLLGNGSFTINSATNTWSGGTMTGSGQFIIPVAAIMDATGAGARTSSKVMNVAGRLNLAVGGNKVLVLNANPIITGKLDLNDNDMILEYGGGTPIGTIQALINSARNGGAWNGNGITSTSAGTDPNSDTTLGAMEALDYKIVQPGATTFDGVAIDNTAVLVKYTYYGDANFNGQVDGADYGRIDSTFNQEVATQTDIGGWVNGDFNGDGKVDGGDYALIDGAFNSQGGVLRPVLPPTKRIGSLPRV